jgi:hypothetical protein
MPNAPSKVAGEVASRAAGLNAYVARMERLRDAGELSRPDLNRVYGGAFLSFHTYVERSIERLFLGLLMGRFVGPSLAPLIDVRSEVTARKIVNAGKKYVDWLPFDRHTEPRAAAFLSGGRPFTDLARADRRTLDQLGIIRNALAHESTHALRQFRRTYTDDRALPPEQLTPAGYLRGQHSLGTTRFTNTVNEVVNVFTRMCA